MTTASLAELMICAASEAWRNNGEVLASGITTIPRLAASLAKLTHSPELLMTDSESYLVAEPLPLGVRNAAPLYEGYMGFERVFECVWGGQRHAMIGPTQIDRWGQTNLSALGDYAKPKVAMLGVRGLPGNSINHANSLFVPAHNAKVFVAGEVDMVSGVGAAPQRWANGMSARFVDLRIVVTDLCVLDFGGADRASGCGFRIKRLHPGVTEAEVRAATGFALGLAPDLCETPLPTEAQLTIIQRLDPLNLRASVLKGNPSAIKTAA
jgi:glutaconate CoA-transferase subunit B